VEFLALGLALIGAKSRRHDFFRHPGADGRDQERRDTHEIPVGKRVHAVGRIHDVGGGLRQPGEEHVHRTNHEVGAVTAGHAGEGRGETEKRVPAECVEKGGRQRGEQHISHLAAGVGHHAGEDDHGGDEFGRGVEDKESQHRTHQAGVFRDADAKHTGERDAERRVGQKVPRQLENHALDALDGKQVDHRHDLAAGGVGDLHAEAVEDPRKHHDQGRQQGEQGGRMRQRIAGALYGAEKTLKPRRVRGRSGGGGIPRSNRRHSRRQFPALHV
jgi:hypothetical protein